MAKSKRTKVFEIKNKKYRFDHTKFNFVFNEYCIKNGITKDKLENDLSYKISISKNAIHNWRFGLNGPSTLEIIISVSELLCERKYLSFLEEVIDMNEKTEDIRDYEEKYSELQIQSIKRIYDKIVEFLYEFKSTGGFTTTLWFDFLEQGYTDPQSAIYDYIEEKLDNIYLIVQKEYFYLHGLKIYEEIFEFVDNDLIETYDSKLGYAYRFEAGPNGNPTTEEDYEKALKKINGIIFRCIL